MERVTAFADDDKSRRRKLLHLGARRRNRKHVIEHQRSIFLFFARVFALIGRGVWNLLRVVGTVVVAAGLLAGLYFGGGWAIHHVTSSPRFALTNILVTPSAHVSADEIRQLAEIEEGARLLAIDPDDVAARIAQHPWVSSVRVERQLPSSLAIDLVERKALAVASLDGLYLIDESGRPFKRATTAEAQALPVLTGIERAHYVAHQPVAEAALREALGVLAAYGAKPERPELSELNLHARHGYTLYLLDGGAEIRLGRGEIEQKLARFDQIFEAVKKDVTAIRTVHLDGGNARWVPVRLATAEAAGGQVTAPGGKHGKHGSQN